MYNSKQPVLLTETCTTPNIRASKHLKASFINNDSYQSKDYVKNLENNLLLNKTIISELAKVNLPNGQTKKIIEAINAENANLQTQLKKTVKERDDAQSKLLIVEQMVEVYKKREIEYNNEMECMKTELIDQLNRKEFLLQKLERNYEKAINAMRLSANRDQNIGKVLRELKVDSRTEGTVTNVIEANNTLKTELNKQKQKVKELTNEIIRSEVKKRIHITNEAESNEQPTKKAILKFNQWKPSLPNESKVDELKEEIKILKKRAEDLYIINLKISQALKDANAKLLNVNQRKRSVSKGKIKEIDSKGDNRAKSQDKKKFSFNKVKYNNNSKQEYIMDKFITYNLLSDPNEFLPQSESSNSDSDEKSKKSEDRKSVV